MNPFYMMQTENCCGPYSLSACLTRFGVERTPKDLLHKTGAPSAVRRGGASEVHLMRAARVCGFRAKEYLVTNRMLAYMFLAKVMFHLFRKGPFLLLTYDLLHWVAVVGFCPKREKFIVYDPEDSSAICYWGVTRFLRMAWNTANKEDGELSQFCAILLSRRNGKKPQRRFDGGWLREYDIEV